MKKQNSIIADLESRTEALGGVARVERYTHIREAIVDMKFGKNNYVGFDCSLMVSIGPKGAIKYCSWFFMDANGQWSVHHDEKCFTGKRNAQEVEWFFNQMQRHAMKEAA